jgi:hypothetical protein
MAVRFSMVLGGMGSVAQIACGVHLVNPAWRLGCMSRPDRQDPDLARL